ncbi:hypothetical protein HYU17_01695 [Candidatus Woesearchaeota archaeon]|nr:hypothetical protein [Candidatus Woesearchaeota archaeon]
MVDNPSDFGKRGQSQQEKAFALANPNVLQGIAEVERRLRMLEERYSNLERRSQVTEENMLSSNRKLRAEIKLTGEDLSDVKGQVADMVEKLKALIKELQGFARLEDVDVIRKYLNLIEPLGFVTQGEVERIVRQAVEDALVQQVAEQREKL